MNDVYAEEITAYDDDYEEIFENMNREAQLNDIIKNFLDKKAKAEQTLEC